VNNLGFPDPDSDEDARDAIWWHSLAVAFSPLYLEDNADGLTIDWPRIPLPDDRAIFDSSVALGRRLAGLLDTEADVPGITSGAVADHFKTLGNISATDLRITASWGSKDSRGRINPGNGKVEIRTWKSGENAALKSGFAAVGVAEPRGFELLGPPVDVYLNGTTHWQAVPEAVWNYYIGGYKVIKKWLSYREESVLGRALSKEEAREVTAMVRRIAAIILMTDELDENYIATRDHAHPWGP
jgi:hypothetical protein